MIIKYIRVKEDIITLINLSLITFAYLRNDVFVKTKLIAIIHKSKNLHSVLIEPKQEICALKLSLRQYVLG